MSIPDVLTTSDGRHIAYHRRCRQKSGKKPGVVFFGGFTSDMTGTKAIFLEQVCTELDLDFLRFDYTGHGQSSGGFEEGSIGEWSRDARDAVDALTEGPQIYIGSSMGGWIALLLAREKPAAVAGLIGIAAAPDFTEDSMWAGASQGQRADLMRAGRIAVPSEYGEPLVITRHLIEDSRRYMVLREPLTLNFPVRLLHGTADLDVPQERALALMSHIEGDDVRLVLVRGSDHRMSGETELALLKETLNALI